MRLLIIGSLEGHVSSASQVALSRGARISHVLTIKEGLQFIRLGQGADLVFIDVVLDVKDFMTSLTQERIQVPVVACGIGTQSKRAVEAIHAGVQEYLLMPPDPELIGAVLEVASRKNDHLIYLDPCTKQVIQLADQIASRDVSVLITGESGTGKEVLATYIHQKSHRHHQPFVSINCAAIPENLLESELFGHEKGAFTGAIARRIGKFEEANGGTLLLDEISEMHPRLQAKLLRAIQEKEIDRVGGAKPVKVNIRLIATSNRDLIKEVKSGNFREDLYFRLNVISLHLPPLRTRKQDITLLANHFTEKYTKLNGLESKTITPSAFKMLETYEWPGNIRELENKIHRAVLLSNGPHIDSDVLNIRLEALPSQDSSQKEEKDNNTQFVGRTVAEVEKDLIINTLQHCFGNRTHAANLLGISIRTLRNKLKVYNEEDGLKLMAYSGDESELRKSMNQG